MKLRGSSSSQMGDARIRSCGYAFAHVHRGRYSTKAARSCEAAGVRLWPWCTVPRAEEDAHAPTLNPMTLIPQPRNPNPRTSKMRGNLAAFAGSTPFRCSPGPIYEYIVFNMKAHPTTPIPISRATEGQESGAPCGSAAMRMPRTHGLAG